MRNLILLWSLVAIVDGRAFGQAHKRVSAAESEYEGYERLFKAGKDSLTFDTLPADFSMDAPCISRERADGDVRYFWYRPTITLASDFGSKVRTLNGRRLREGGGLFTFCRSVPKEG